MSKENTNFLEILLRNMLIGLTMYDDEGNPILIEELNYDPIVKKIFIKSGEFTYKFSMDKYYDFEMDSKLKKLITSKIKIKGKRNK
jgi:hypothetical protein